MTVTKAAATGTIGICWWRCGLGSLRVWRIRTHGRRALAALSRRLLEIARELEALDAEGSGDDIGNAAATPDERWASSRDGDVGSGAADPPQ
jgi:hypothetical protein